MESQRFLEANPNIFQTPEGFKRVSQFLEGIAQRHAERTERVSGGKKRQGLSLTSTATFRRCTIRSGLKPCAPASSIPHRRSLQRRDRSQRQDNSHNNHNSHNRPRLRSKQQRQEDKQRPPKEPQSSSAAELTYSAMGSGAWSEHNGYLRTRHRS
jgi:hypothetical protein